MIITARQADTQVQVLGGHEFRTSRIHREKGEVATMATTRTRKTATKATQAEANEANTPTPKATATKTRKAKYDPASLPETGSTQFRHGGDYKPHVRALAAFAKGNTTLTGHVKALIHLGWVKPGGVNAASKSGACVYADNADLPASSWTIGEPAAPQISANLQALAEAGAPPEALDGLWAAYVGV